MIIGVGIDVVTISRIGRMIERYGDRFLRKVFSDEEIADGAALGARAQFFAGRFAAREAFFKALGTGWGRGLSLREVTVTTAEHGRPVLVLSSRVEEKVRELGASNAHLSITHEGDQAQAIVILDRAGS